MSYANVQVGGYFSAQTRAELAIKKAIGGVLTFLTKVMTPKPDVYIAVESFDAAIVARDNNRIEIAKLTALQAAI